MRLAERSRHVWNIENIGYWTFYNPIPGPVFEIEGVEDVTFRYSLEVRDTNEVILVFKGSATAMSSCWMSLRVSACVLTPANEEVSLTSKDVDPFSELSTTILELSSLDGKKIQCLEHGDLTILIRISERLVSVPTQKTQENRIPSTKIIGVTGGSNKTSKKHHFQIYKSSRCPTVARFQLVLINSKGRIRQIGESYTFLFAKWEAESWEMPESTFLSTFEKEDRLSVDRNLRLNIEFSYKVPAPHSSSRGNTKVTHSYRHHIVQESPDNRYDILPKLKRDRWTDLNLLTEDGMSFPVHRCVLVARSRYFEALLSINMAEKDKKEIHLKDVDSSVMGHLLDFLYSGTFPEDLSVQTTVGLCALASYLEMLELCGFCLHHIMKKLRFSNIIRVVPLLKLHYHPDLDEELQRIIVGNFRNRPQMTSRSEGVNQIVTRGTEGV